MSMLELFMIALGLSMDAFAVAICKGLSMKTMSWKNAVITGLYFGGFQAGMPLIGYFLGTSFRDMITSIDHWIAFVLLGLIGAGMIKEALGKEEEGQNDCFDVKTMVPLAVATSIDALAVGVTFALFGLKFKAKAELAGGIILILMGFKILLEHLGVISF